MVLVADLVARVRSEGVQETAAQVRAVGQEAQTTARALQIMAEAASRANPGQGSAGQILEFFTRANVQPTAAAMAQASQEMQKTAAAATQAVQPVQATARAAAEHASAAANGARAAQNVAEGWKLSESSVARFGAGLFGVGLGLSLAAGAARLIHDAVIGTAESISNWERGLVRVRAQYGDLAPRIVALSQAQAALPGVISSQQELLQANAAAGFLTTRYGISPTLTGRLTTQAARLGGLFLEDDQGRAALQSAFIEYARSGGGAAQLEAATGQPFDPETLARRLGFHSAAALQGLTPQQQIEARSQLSIATAAQTNIQGGQESRGLLDRQRDLQHNLEQTQAALLNGLENLAAPTPPAVAGQSELAQASNFPLLGPAGERQQRQDIARGEQQQADFVAQQEAYRKAVEDAQAAVDANAASLADNRRQLDEANAALARLGVEAGSATARLLDFAGSLEERGSIARGDVAAQAQGAVAARARSAIAPFGTPDAEINYLANQTAYQQAYQNYIALRAQQTGGDNAIRRYLEVQANEQGPGLENQRGAAQRALDEAARTAPLQARLGQAQRQSSLVDLAAADTQARLDAISLTQRERQIQLLHETIDLRRLDLQQQQAGLRATEDVIRAQQAALPVQAITSAARYQQNLASAISLQRMARLLQGRDVSDLPSVNQLIGQNYQGQLAEAENAPSVVRTQRGVEVAQQSVSALSLSQALTETAIRQKEMVAELKNLEDLPAQLALQAELAQNNRDQLSVQTEMREYLKAITYYMTQRPPQLVPADRGDRIDAAGAPRAPGELAGARR